MKLTSAPPPSLTAASPLLGTILPPAMATAPTLPSSPMSNEGPPDVPPSPSPFQLREALNLHHMRNVTNVFRREIGISSEKHTPLNLVEYFAGIIKIGPWTHMLKSPSGNLMALHFLAKTIDDATKDWTLERCTPEQLKRISAIMQELFARMLTIEEQFQQLAFAPRPQQELLADVHSIIACKGLYFQSRLDWIFTPQRWRTPLARAILHADEARRRYEALNNEMAAEPLYHFIHQLRTRHQLTREPLDEAFSIFFAPFEDHCRSAVQRRRSPDSRRSRELLQNLDETSLGLTAHRHTLYRRVAGLFRECYQFELEKECLQQAYAAQQSALFWKVVPQAVNGSSPSR